MFTKETAIELLTLSDTVDFPVDFDAAWQWLGYSRKDNAKRFLLSCDFSVGTDLLIREEPTTTGIQAKPKETICLTVECLKMWAMMSNTEQGKQVRRYFLECEKIAKASVKPMTTCEMILVQAQAMVKLERQQLEFNLALKAHDDRLEAVEYHTAGFEGYESLKGYCNVKGIDMTKFNPSITAKLIVKHCKQNNYEVRKVKDSRYGQVNAYPTEALDTYFVN